MKQTMFRRLAALLLAAVLFIGALPAAQAVEAPLTRGQCCQMLLNAARHYDPDLQPSDILKGYPDGSLRQDEPLTRAQALVMLGRAFPDLPVPTGDAARMAIPAETVSDLPQWAQAELAPVLSAGIVAGTGGGRLSPELPMTAGDLEALIRRVYTLKASRLQDDFYAAVNKSWLDASQLSAGQSISGPFYDLSGTVNSQIASLITKIAAKPQAAGTPEAKIKALYDTVLDQSGRTAAGVQPLAPYLSAIEDARTLPELMAADCRMQRELGISTLAGFGLTADLADSSKKIVAFSLMGPSMDKGFYTAPTQAQSHAWQTYYTRLLTLSGVKQETAQAQVRQVLDAETLLSAASMDPQEYGDVHKIYNLFSLAQLQDLLPAVDLSAILDACGLDTPETVLVTDPGQLKAAASLFDQAHLDLLKTESRLALLQSYGATLNLEFQDAAVDFVAGYYGLDQRQSLPDLAAQQVQSLLSDYLSQAYVEAYFDPQAKADVEQMIRQFLSIFKERIQAQDWMSDATKARAIKKLDTMGIKVGYPDAWDAWLDAASLRSPSEGGSFFSNTVAIQLAAKAHLLASKDQPVDKSQWALSPYTVNACYSASANDITFPAAILQAPLYDVHASREENLGGIGYIIAHEITHAFDNNGAKFDENGNAADWWTPEDYAAFQQKCQEVAQWYDAQEVYPGIRCSGALTVSENVADLGSVRCLLEAVKAQNDPDYDTLFRAIANTWASTTSRQMRQYLAQTDVHAPDKLRCNRVLQTLPEFYDTYGIVPGDGMWTQPETRVSIW